MRYRPSHVVRMRQINKPRRYEHLLRRVGMYLAGSALVIMTIWAIIFSDESSDALAWLLNRPVPIDTQISDRSAGFKKDVFAFQELELALSRALINLQVSSSQIRETQSRKRLDDDTWRAVKRTIRISDSYSLTQCNLEISRAVDRAGGQVVSAAERRRSQELLLDIAYDGETVYHLTIVRDPLIARKSGRLAIILMDTGNSRRAVLDQFLKIDRPMTFGFIPWASGAVQMAGEAVGKNHEVIAYLPMEPGAYPQISPGRTAILLEQDEPTNRQVVRDGLSRLSVAAGVSNYMGDRIRNTPPAFKLVLDEVNRLNKYYIDDIASSKQARKSINEQKGLPYHATWGALDVYANQEQIAMCLDQVSFEVLEQGAAIVTAQIRPDVLAVLSHKLEQLELRGIEFVHVSDIIAEKE